MSFWARYALVSAEVGRVRAAACALRINVGKRAGSRPDFRSLMIPSGHDD
jgi:hypothetical protein